MSVPTRSSCENIVPGATELLAAPENPAIQPSGSRVSRYVSVCVTLLESGVPRFHVTTCVRETREGSDERGLLETAVR